MWQQACLLILSNKMPKPYQVYLKHMLTILMCARVRFFWTNIHEYTESHLSGKIFYICTYQDSKLIPADTRFAYSKNFITENL